METLNVKYGMFASVEARYTGARYMGEHNHFLIQLRDLCLTNVSSTYPNLSDNQRVLLVLGAIFGNALPTLPDAMWQPDKSSKVHVKMP